jgi:hypothetical protein
MKFDVYKKWTEALRSGEYKQCKGKMEEDGKFCCLGVLTDLYNKEHLKCPVEFQNEFGNEELRAVVADWAGMKSSSGNFVCKNGNETNLADINDSERAKRGFKGIAKIIDRHWQKL